MNKLEKLLLKAYRMGQESVSYMKMINQGRFKPSHSFLCDDDPCEHKIKKEDQTTTIEDEMLKTLLKP